MRCFSCKGLRKEKMGCVTEGLYAARVQLCLFLWPVITHIGYAQPQTHHHLPFFQASKKQPYHISVGAILFNKKGYIACHHFKKILGHPDIYILMRKSMENKETILNSLKRGLMEEFGATAKPLAFVGSLSGYLPDSQLPFEKTTLYIVCQKITWNPNKRDKNDPEASSIIEWHQPNQLIKLMQKQGEKYHRIDVDESSMILRALPYIEEALKK